jgi:tetratricopeptide (TPR) repeat protein
MSTLLVLTLATALAPSSVQTEAAAAPAATDRGAAYHHFSLGMQARFTGDTETALSEFRKARELDPRAAAIRVETARLYRETGNLDEATAEAEEAVRLDKDSADAHLILAQLYQIQAVGPGAEAAIRKAVAEYEEVARLRPADGHSLLNMAGIYGQLQEHPEAARAWELYLALDPGNFEAHLQRGTHLLLAGQPDEAAEVLKTALELQPDSARAYQILGEIYARGEQNEEAAEHYRKALEHEPGNIRVRLALGEVLQQSREFEGALEQAEAVLVADARNRFALDLKGRALRDLRRFDEADAAADQLLAEDPDDLKSSFLKVTIAEQRRDFEAAAALLEDILEGSDPEAADAADNERVFRVHLGFAYQQLGRFEEAAEAFRQAQLMTENPSADLLSFRAEALYQGKMLEEALEAVRSARERFPEDPDLIGLEATLLRETGDEPGGAALIEQLREASPEDTRVLERVADFYRRAQDYPRAEDALRQARVLEPKSLSILFQLGAVLERKGAHDDAELVFREALEVDSESAPVLNYLGYMNADRNIRVLEALELIQKAVDIDPGSAAYRDSLGWALYRLNRLEAAEEAVRIALEKDGNNAVILDHLADILSKRGRVAEALLYWQRALEGEDEESELDRPRVEAKIREAQLVLRAQQQEPVTPTP